MDPRLTNLNAALEPVLESNDQQLLERFLDCQLKPTTLIAVIRKTKNYSAFAQIASTLNMKNADEDDLAQLYTDAICEDRIDELPYDMDIACSIAQECGFRGLTLQNIPQGYYNKFGYSAGIVEADNLQLLKKNIAYKPTFLQDVCRLSCGKYFAIKIMDYLGYDEKHLWYYFNGAVSAQNWDCLRHLHQFPPLHKKFEKEAQWCIERFTPGTDLGYLHLVLKEGIVKFSNEDWQTIKKHHNQVYQALNADV